MPSKQYIYESNALKARYINGSISYDAYKSSIEFWIKWEADRAYFSRDSKLEELYDFEDKQLKEANQEIEQRNREKREQEEKVKREEEELLKSMTSEQRLETELYKEREQFYKNEVPKIIEEYKGESKRYRDTHITYQWIIIAGSTIVTSITGITIFSNTLAVKILAAAISILVSISAGVTGYFKYRERSMNLQETADDIEDEYEALRLGTHCYLNQPRKEAMGIFADTIRSRIKQQKKQQQILEQPSETKQIQNQT